MGLQRFPIGNFHGGWNLRDAPESLQPNEATQVLNVTLADVVGVLTQRAGKARFDTAGFPAATVVDNMRSWATASVMALSINGSVYTCDVGGVLTLRVTGTAGTVWSFEQATDAANTNYLWMMNGVDTPRKMTTGFVVSNWANSPPNGRVLKMWKNRMCVSLVDGTKQRLFFSNIGDPENPATAYGTQWADIKTTDDDLDDITDLNVLGDYLYAFKRRSVWKVTNGNPPWDNQRLGSPGAYARFQTVELPAEGKLYYLSAGGIYSIDTQGNIDEESDAINPLWTGMQPRVSMNYYTAARIMATPQGRILATLPMDSATANNFVIELMPRMNQRKVGGGNPRIFPSLVLHDYKVSAMCRFQPNVAAPEVIMAGASNAAKIHQLFTGTNDDGVAISSYWQSGWKGLITEEPKERIRRVNVELQGRVTVSMYKDFKTVPTFIQQLISTDDPDPNWDSGTWDSGPWDPLDGIELKRARPESHGRYHAIRFSNSDLDKTFTIYAAEFALRGGKEH